MSDPAHHTPDADRPTDTTRDRSPTNANRQTRRTAPGAKRTGPAHKTAALLSPTKLRAKYTQTLMGRYAGRTVWHDILQRSVRVLNGVVRELSREDLSLRAMSLVYTTLLSIVPVLAISFSVLKGFGVHNQMEPFLLNLLAPLGDKATEITTNIISFVNNTNVQVLGFIGFGILFYTVISLMQKIESAFNHVWQVHESRAMGERFRDYLSVIVVGPALVFSALGAMASVVSASGAEDVARSIEPLAWLVDTLKTLMPTLMIIGAFTFIYAFIPNTKVRFASAFTGGVVAGTAWNLMGWVFATFVAQSASYTTIYSGFATPIVFMVWLYMSWMVLLIGASIAFFHQNPDQGQRAWGKVQISIHMKERLALLIAAAIGERFYAGEQPFSNTDLARRLKVHALAIAPVLDTLEKHGFITQTMDRPPRYLPARPWESVPVSDLLMTTRTASDWGNSPPDDPDHYRPVDTAHDRVESAMVEVLGAMTLKDLAVDPGRNPESPGTTAT